MTRPTTAYLAAYAIPQHVPADDRLLPLLRGAERRGWVTLVPLDTGAVDVALTEAGRREAGL
jgi:hypothetical protein